MQIPWRSVAKKKIRLCWMARVHLSPLNFIKKSVRSMRLTVSLTAGMSSISLRPKTVDTVKTASPWTSIPKILFCSRRQNPYWKCKTGSIIALWGRFLFSLGNFFLPRRSQSGTNHNFLRTSNLRRFTPRRAHAPLGRVESDNLLRLPRLSQWAVKAHGGTSVSGFLPLDNPTYRLLGFENKFSPPFEFKTGASIEPPMTESWERSGSVNPTAAPSLPPGRLAGKSKSRWFVRNPKSWTSCFRPC